MGIEEVTKLVDKFVLQNTAKKPAASTAKVCYYFIYLFTYFLNYVFIYDLHFF